MPACMPVFFLPTVSLFCSVSNRLAVTCPLASTAPGSGATTPEGPSPPPPLRPPLFQRQCEPFSPARHRREARSDVKRQVESQHSSVGLSMNSSTACLPTPLTSPSPIGKDSFRERLARFTGQRAGTRHNGGWYEQETHRVGSQETAGKIHGATRRETKKRHNDGARRCVITWLPD